MENSKDNTTQANEPTLANDAPAQADVVSLNQEIPKVAEVLNRKENSTAKALCITAVIVFIFGAIAGVVFGTATDIYGYSQFRLSVVLTWWIGTLVCGITLLGLSEVVALLHKINKKLK